MYSTESIRNIMKEIMAIGFSEYRLGSNINGQKRENRFYVQSGW